MKKVLLFPSWSILIIILLIGNTFVLKKNRLMSLREWTYGAGDIPYRDAILMFIAGALLLTLFMAFILSTLYLLLK